MRDTGPAQHLPHARAHVAGEVNPHSGIASHMGSRDPRYQLTRLLLHDQAVNVTTRQHDIPILNSRL